MKPYFIFYIALLLGCSESSNYKSEKLLYKFPLLKECEAPMHDYLKELGSRFEISSAVSIFDQVIPSHPDVIGYIEISGEKESLFSLEAMANAVIIDCYPISKFTIDSSGHYGDELLSLVKQNREVGLKSYILESEEGFEVFVKNKLVR